MTGNHNHNNPGLYTTPPTPACQTNARRISDYLSHTLSTSDTANLQQHLASCSFCTSTLNSYSTLDQQIKTLPNPPASPRVRAVVMNAIAASESDKRSLKPVRMAGVVNRAPRLASSMAALAMLAAFAGALGLMFTGRSLIPATPALASPTAGVPASITPALGSAAAKGTLVAQPDATGTPLPQALIVQSVQASAIESSTNLVFTSVDSAGMTQTIASRPNVIKDAPIALSPDQTDAAYTVHQGNDVKVEVYNLTSHKVAGSMAVPSAKSSNYYSDLPDTSISHDDKQLAYSRFYDGNEDTGVFDIARGQLVTPPTPHTQPGLPTSALIRPIFIGWGVDGFIYNWEAGEGGWTRVWASSTDGKQTKIVSTDAYHMNSKPLMSNDGKYLYFLAIDEKGTWSGGPFSIIMRYDVSSGSFGKVADAGGQQVSGPLAEAPDDSSLLYIESGKQPGSMEIRRAGLRTPIDNQVAEVKAPDGASNIEVSTMQVCGTTVFYQETANPATPKQQTQLVAQPLNGGAAKVLPLQGQLIGCSISR